MSTHHEHHDGRRQVRDGAAGTGAAPDTAALDCAAFDCAPTGELARMGVARQVKQQRRGNAAAVLRSLAGTHLVLRARSRRNAAPSRSENRR